MTKEIYVPTRTEKPFSGLVVDWYNDNEVVVYQLVSVTNDTVYKWAEYVQHILADWSKERPYRAVHDLSQGGVALQFASLVNFDMMNIGVTLEGRIAVEDLFSIHDGWTAQVAVNFNLSLSGQTSRTLLNHLNPKHIAIQYKTFYNRAKCLKWLATGMTDTAEMKLVDKDTTKPTSDDAKV